MSANALTIVTAAGSLAKHVTVIDGGVTHADDPFWPRIVSFETVGISGADDLLDVLSSAAEYHPAPCVVRAEPLADMGRRAIYDDPQKGAGGNAPCPQSMGRLRHREGSGGRHRPAARARAGRRQGTPLPAAPAP